MKKLRIPAIAAALLTLLAVGCSESDGPEKPENPADNNPTQSAFRLTADDLNTHLPDADEAENLFMHNDYLMAADGASVYMITVTPTASRSFSFCHNLAFVEVPACGGDYRIEVNELAYLQKVALIEGIDESKLEDKSSDNLAEYRYELVQAVENENPAYSVALTELNDFLEIEDRSFGEVVDYKIGGETPFYTYRFPENHTGEYRVFALYGYHLWRPPFWEMHDPDMKPIPMFTPVLALQYPE